MIIDFSTHFGHAPGMPDTFTPQRLLESQASAGIELSVASDIGHAFASDNPLVRPLPNGLVSFASVRPGFDPQSLTNVKGVRIYPAYQAWDFDSSYMAELLSVAQNRKLIIQLCLRLHDPRALPTIRPPDSALPLLTPLAAANADLKFVISGATFREITAHPALFQRDNVWADTSHVQHPINSLDKLVASVGSSRLVFGSNSPIYYPYAAVFRVLNSRIAEADRNRILHSNAHELLGVY